MGFEDSTVKQLQDQADARGLATSGTKAELIARLEEDAAKTAKTEKDAAAAAAAELAVGDVVVDDAGRHGMIVGAGRKPNPNHRDSEGNAKPESAEPLVVWLPEPTPYGGALTAAL